MALAQAQLVVVALAKKMVAMGKDVKYAIHPVAGRMPGHMNVILAEAEVDYENLLEMDMANPQFAETDVALVVARAMWSIRRPWTQKELLFPGCRS